MKYAIAKIVNSTTADIDHFADTIYFQGCSIHCSFCFNPELQQEGKPNMSIKEIINKLQNEWVVLTGGEPAEQDILQLLQALHKAKKKVAILTSYNIELPAEHIHIDIKEDFHGDFKTAKNISYGLVCRKELDYNWLQIILERYPKDTIYLKGEIDYIDIIKELVPSHIKCIIGEPIHV